MERLQSESPKVRRIYLISPALLQGISWLIGRGGLNFFAQLVVSGQDNVRTTTRLAQERGTGVIFALNHTHELDFSFPLAGVSPASPLFPMFYVAHGRSNYFKNTTLSWRRYIYGLPIFLTSWGAHPYQAGQKDYARALGYHARLLQLGKSMCIFPEGKIREEESRPTAHGGLGYLAATTRALVVPVSVSGVHKMTTYEFLTRKRKLHIHYGKPLYPHDIIDFSLPIPDRYQKASQKVMGIIHDAITNGGTP